MRADYQHLPGDSLDARIAVYPGHPITIAYLITMKYPNFESAFVKVGKWGDAAALADCDIPGAGGNVSAALELLFWLRDGTFKKVGSKSGRKTWDVAVSWADDYWSRCDSQNMTHQERWKKGQEQADQIKPLLKARRSWWKIVREEVSK